jgi:hypothetical protein
MCFYGSGHPGVSLCQVNLPGTVTSGFDASDLICSGNSNTEFSVTIMRELPNVECSSDSIWTFGHRAGVAYEIDTNFSVAEKNDPYSSLVRGTAGVEVNNCTNPSEDSFDADLVAPVHFLPLGGEGPHQTSPHARYSRAIHIIAKKTRNPGIQRKFHAFVKIIAMEAIALSMSVLMITSRAVTICPSHRVWNVHSMS